MDLPVPQTIGDWVALLESGRPFSCANIGGDGEFLAITGATGVNSDGRAYNPEVGAELAKVLLEPRLTFHGFNPGGHHRDANGDPCQRDQATRLDAKRAAAEDWLRTHGINVPVQTPGTLTDPDFGRARTNVRWVHKEIISSANARGELGPFIRALRECRPLVVGPPSLTDAFVHGVLGADASYLTEMGWAEMDAIEEFVRDKIDMLLRRHGVRCVITWSMGYVTKVLMWRIALDYPDITQIDMGACWEAYCGVHSRHGYRKPEWSERMAKNLSDAGIG